jgi:PPOX class probable F420-dependent enzyme
MELAAEVCDGLLAHWPVARLATRTPAGRPHAVPVVFARFAGALFVPVDGKPKSGRPLARVRNLRAHPEACLLLDHYAPAWDALWWLRVDGRAEVLEGAGDLPEGAVAALRAKYPQYAEVPLFRGEPTALRLLPERVSSWCAGPEAARAAARAARAG